MDAVQDARRVQARPAPVTLPPAAWGPEPVEWYPSGEQQAVWVWIQWVDGIAEHLPGTAVGWNERVVNVHFVHAGGTRDTMVWRNAVTRRDPIA